MSAVGHVLLTAVGWVLAAQSWVLLGYVVALGVIFACLLVMAFAALLGWEPWRRMPTDREWERTLADWTREAKDDRNERGGS